MSKLRLVQDLEYSYVWSLQERSWGIWFERQRFRADTPKEAQSLLDDLTNRTTLYPTVEAASRWFW